MSDPSSRRAFLRAGIAATAAVAGGADAAPVAPAKRIAALAELRPGHPLNFTYPQAEAAVLLDMGRRVDGGVGPNGSIVAFSALCQHMGCPVNFDPRQSKLVCSCHASVFDPARGGDCVEGPSTRGLPRITLKIDGGSVFATGVAGGLVYGRDCNRA
jgi:arsenite oxidase small subunit